MDLDSDLCSATSDLTGRPQSPYLWNGDDESASSRGDCGDKTPREHFPRNEAHTGWLYEVGRRPLAPSQSGASLERSLCQLLLFF